LRSITLFYKRTNIAAFPRPFPKKGAVYRVVFGKKRPNTSVRLLLLKSLLNALSKQIFLTPLACWRGNSLNLLLFFLGLFIRTIWFFVVCSLFLMLFLFIFYFLALASFCLHFLSSSPYLNNSLAIPRILSRHLRFPPHYPTAPSPASIARYIHLGFVFWYREISICFAGIGYSASS
jgi:hypothetical protein